MPFDLCWKPEGCAKSLQWPLSIHIFYKGLKFFLKKRRIQVILHLDLFKILKTDIRKDEQTNVEKQTDGTYIVKVLRWQVFRWFGQLVVLSGYYLIQMFAHSVMKTKAHLQITKYNIINYYYLIPVIETTRAFSQTWHIPPRAAMTQTILHAVFTKKIYGDF